MRSVMANILTAALTLTTMSVASVSAADGAVRHPAKLAHVIDATTYVLDVDVNGHSTRITVGLANLQVPKVYGNTCERSAALDAKAFARNILKPNDNVTVFNLGRQGGRFVADIELEGRNLREVLVQFRQVAPPGLPVPWCSAEGSSSNQGSAG